MVNKRIFIAFALLAVIVAALPVSAQDPLIDSVCLITDVGKVNDGTFNQFAFEGMVAAAEDFDLESTFIETTSPTDYASNIQRCIDSEFDAIVTVGFLMTDATLVAAQENSEIYFMGVDQGFAEAPENLVGVQFREDQSGFIAGALAALMSESGTVAGVYGIPIPPVVKFRNGFEQGAMYVNPDISTLGVYIDNFNDPARGAETALQLIDEGADVIFGAGGPTGSGGIKEAAGQGVLVIGVDQDEYFSTFGEGETPGAENIISSAVKRVDQGVYLSIEALVNGDAAAFYDEDGNRAFSAENDGIGFAPAHDADVPEEVIEQLNEIYAGLQDGSIETGVDPNSGELMEMMEPEATEEASG